MAVAVPRRPSDGESLTASFSNVTMDSPAAGLQTPRAVWIVRIMGGTLVENMGFTSGAPAVEIGSTTFLVDDATDSLVLTLVGC